MKVMKAQRKKDLEENVLHKGYEDQKQEGAGGRSPS